MTTAQQNIVVRIKQLIWLYFVLLIFEGALRKWVLPSLSAPLLIVRDPVVILIYVLAFKLRIFPRNGFVMWGGLLAILCLVAGFLAYGNTTSVAIYGFRADFLHWPLVWIVPRVFGAQDIKRIGTWTLILAAPLTLLMVMQFMAPRTSWLNTGAGGEGGQIGSAGGHIRPAGPFSFVSGPIYYCAFVAVFLFYGQLKRGQYPLWLILPAALSLVAAVSVSGSRTMLMSVGLVVACAFFAGAVLQPMLLFRWIWSACFLVIILVSAQSLPFMQEGLSTFETRIATASSIEGGSEGMAGRAMGSFTRIGPLMYESPLLGYGLGKGTNVGSQLLTGDVQFLLAEEEWSRVVLESGPILGVAFLLWRVCLAGWLGWAAAKKAILGDPLPLLLFGVCGLGIINGQLGQASSQGLITFVSAMCLSAINCASPSTLRRKKSVNAWNRRPDFGDSNHASGRPARDLVGDSAVH